MAPTELGLSFAKGLLIAISCRETSLLMGNYNFLRSMILSTIKTLKPQVCRQIDGIGGGALIYIKPSQIGCEINYVKRLQNVSSKLLGEIAPYSPPPLRTGLNLRGLCIAKKECFDNDTIETGFSIDQTRQ